MAGTLYHREQGVSAVRNKALIKSMGGWKDDTISCLGLVFMFRDLNYALVFWVYMHVGRVKNIDKVTSGIPSRCCVQTLAGSVEVTSLTCTM